MSELRFEHVSVRYGTGRGALTAVDDVSLVVPSGAVVGLVGESGSGKSTLARSAVGLSPVSAGRVLLDGARVDQRTWGRRPVQMVFQDPYASLDPRMTIGESVAEAIPRSVLRGAARRAEVSRLLELVMLDPDRSALLPGHLSGGQLQRVALARALAGRPRVVVADEITSALDVSVQGAVLNLVRDVQRGLGLTMLFISHNLAVVRYVSDYLAVMYLGRVVEVGTVDQVLGDPQHPYTRELLDAAPSRGSSLLAVERDVAVDPDPPDPHDPPGGCHFHPRCPVGPQVLPERDVCRNQDPAGLADQRAHAAACHFARLLDPQEPVVATQSGPPKRVPGTSD